MKVKTLFISIIISVIALFLTSCNSNNSQIKSVKRSIEQLDKDYKDVVHSDAEAFDQACYDCENLIDELWDIDDLTIEQQNQIDQLYIDLIDARIRFIKRSVIYLERNHENMRKKAFETAYETCMDLLDDLKDYDLTENQNDDRKELKKRLKDTKSWWEHVSGPFKQ